MKKIILKRKKDAAVKRFHPWVFSGAIHQIEGDPVDGDLVAVHNAEGQFLAIGHFQKGSISVRIISFEETTIDQNFWIQKIEAAKQLRKELGFIENPSTNCYRLVHAEGDQLPGLIIDIYNKTAVIQCHSIGMHRQLKEISSALLTVYADTLEAIFDKSTTTLPSNYAAEVDQGYLLGTSGKALVKENEHLFEVDWENGQKTGFFLDQRDNRHLLARYVHGKRVLNTFCYSGGFSIYALKAGAQQVVSIDSSAKAIQLTTQNLALNGLDPAKHEAHTADVLSYFQQSSTPFDLLVVDPPAFAKKRTKRHNAVQGYKRLNKEAIKQLAPGGLLFTFSCSQVVDRQLFEHTIVAAALECGRSAQVLHHLSQPPDHPISLFHPEGNYLKGMVLRITS